LVAILISKSAEVRSRSTALLSVYNSIVTVFHL